MDLSRSLQGIFIDRARSNKCVVIVLFSEVNKNGWQALREGSVFDWELLRGQIALHFESIQGGSVPSSAIRWIVRIVDVKRASENIWVPACAHRSGIGGTTVAGVIFKKQNAWRPVQSIGGFGHTDMGTVI